MSIDATEVDEEYQNFRGEISVQYMQTKMYI